MSAAPHSTVRLRRVPASDPPYDDERHPDTWGVPMQPPLELAPPGRPGIPHPDGHAVPRRTPTTSAQAPIRVMAVRFVNTSLEIINGLRPASHLRALTSPLEAGAVLTSMSHASRRLRRAVRRGGDRRDELIKLRRMRVYEPRPGAVEVAAVIGAGDRVWAAAYRLERRHGRWQCTAAAIL